VDPQDDLPLLDGRVVAPGIARLPAGVHHRKIGTALPPDSGRIPLVVVDRTPLVVVGNPLAAVDNPQLEGPGNPLAEVPVNHQQAVAAEYRLRWVGAGRRLVEEAGLLQLQVVVGHHLEAQLGSPLRAVVEDLLQVVGLVGEQVHQVEEAAAVGYMCQQCLFLQALRCDRKWLEDMLQHRQYHNLYVYNKLTGRRKSSHTNFHELDIGRHPFEGFLPDILFQNIVHP